MSSTAASRHTCPYCGSLVRPAVVWFGEPLDPETLRRAGAAARCDVFLAVGTSALVYPAAGLIHEAKRHGAFTTEINPDATAASDAVDLAIAEPAETALDEIERAWQSGSRDSRFPGQGPEPRL